MADLAPPSPHHTQPSNVDKHPADVLKPEKKRCTKAKKAADDKRLKEEKAAQEKTAQESLEQLAAIEINVEMKEAEARAFRPQPVHPHAQPHAKGNVGGNGKTLSTHNGEGNKKEAKVLVPLSSLAPDDGQGMAVNNDPDIVSISQKIQFQLPVSLKETLREAKAKRLVDIQMMTGMLRE